MLLKYCRVHAAKILQSACCSCCYCKVHAAHAVHPATPAAMKPYTVCCRVHAAKMLQSACCYCMLLMLLLQSVCCICCSCCYCCCYDALYCFCCLLLQIHYYSATWSQQQEQQLQSPVDRLLEAGENPLKKSSITSGFLSF